MLATFWGITAFLMFCAFGFVLPWLKSFETKTIVGIMLMGAAYGLYIGMGSSDHLTHYYSQDERLQRIKQSEFRRLLAEFRKQEFRLRLRLEEDPNDMDAEWRLWDLLAIKSIQTGDYTKAVKHWESALISLQKIPKNKISNEMKKRITDHIKSVKSRLS